MPALPDAFLVRFSEVTGSGLSRESWEIEVLQIGSEIRIRGNVRTGGSSVPVYRPMSRTEFVDFWEWIRSFPLEGFHAREDPAAPRQAWRKRLQYDVVLGPDRRIQSKSEWSRPVLDAPWLGSIESRLHVMLLDLAEQELDHPSDGEGSATDSTSLGVRRALRALGDAEPTNLPGGSPDAE
jgi:hypothetical protein